MNLKILVVILLGVIPAKLFSQSSQNFYEIEDSLKNGEIKLAYTLCIPEDGKRAPIVLIIAGSGPTNKDGNNSMMKNNHLKMLAEELANEGIASFRYDKRFIPGNNQIPEGEVRFDDMIEDADFCFQYIANDKRFGKKYILGHSQGSLIGMKVSQKNKLNGFISLAGPSEPIGNTIIRQITAQNEELGQHAAILIDSMLAGYEVKKINPFLLSVFRPSIQPFLKAYMSYDPCEEIKLLKTKTLIIQGTTDLQVEVTDAEKLHTAFPKSELLIIEGMNHVLKEAPLERSENMKIYYKPDYPVKKELIEGIRAFIK